MSLTLTLVEKKEILYSACIFILLTPGIKNGDLKYMSIYKDLKSKLDKYKNKHTKEYISLVHKTSQIMEECIVENNLTELVPKNNDKSKFKLYTILGIIKLNDLYVWNKLNLQDHLDSITPNYESVKEIKPDEWNISVYNMRFMISFIKKADEVKI